MHQVPEIGCLHQKGTGKSHGGAQLAFKFIEYPWFHVRMYRQSIKELTAEGGMWGIAAAIAKHPNNKHDFKVDYKNHVITHKNGATITACAVDKQQGWTQYSGLPAVLLLFDEVQDIYEPAIHEITANARLPLECPLENPMFRYFGNPKWGQTYDWFIGHFVDKP